MNAIVVLLSEEISRVLSRASVMPSYRVSTISPRDETSERNGRASAMAGTWVIL
jgi:hypothetical protein